MTHDSSAVLSEILSVGYASHEKPYHSERDSLSSYLFRLQTEGSATALVEGNLTKVRAGDLLLYRPQDPYELHIDPLESGRICRSFDYYLFCRGKWIDEWWVSHSRTQVAHVPSEDGILPLWRQIILEHRKATSRINRNSSQPICDYLLRSLCLVIDRVTEEVNPASMSSNVFVAHRMKTFVEQNASSPFTLNDVAKHVGLSVSRTTHLFKASFGQTLMNYAVEVRLRIACERILYGSTSLEEAAVSAGFGSYSYFHRAFKAKYGVSPRMYRQLHL